jgi:integrase
MKIFDTMPTPKTEYRVLFNRRKRTSSRDGRFPIEVEAYIPNARERRYIPTHIKIYPDQWEGGKKRDSWINRKHKNYQNLNNRIAAILTEYNEIEQRYLNDKRPFHLHYLTLDQKQEKEQSFLDYWQTWIDKNPLKYAENTIKGNKTAIGHLRRFRPDILFSDLNDRLILDFEMYLLDYTFEKQGEEYSLKGGSLHSVFKYFQATVNRAIKEHVIEPKDSPFISFSFSHYKLGNDSDIKYLTPTEVKLIEDLEFNKSNIHLMKVRDMFLLSCYTGLRFSDVARLSDKHLVVRTDGTAIDIIQQKTKRRVYIPIYKMFDRKPLHIVQAWKARGNHEIFWDISNQYANRCLKTLASMAEIEKM